MGNHPMTGFSGELQKCFCLCVPSQESSVYLHALSVGSDEDN